MFKIRITNRPIAPHLSIYSPQFSSLFSIWHRITGVFLSCFISFFLLFLKLYTILNFPPKLIYVNFMIFDFYNNIVFNYIYLIILLLLTYHILNGLRHIMWDIGLFLSNKYLYLSSVLFFLILFLILILNF